MEKTSIRALLCAVATAAAGGAVATTPETASPAAGPQAYADLVRPIPNALAALQADDLNRALTDGDVHDAQYYHHHHHHHRWWRRYHHHHHHWWRRYHHHHHWY